MMTTAVLFLLLLAATGVTSQDHFSYDENDPHGPLHWGGICETVSRQSPINIAFDKLAFDMTLSRINFNNYDVSASSLSLVESNNGHTALISLNGSVLPSVTGGKFKREYFLRQFHFHWGPDDEEGSEHTLDGHHYPLELHLVHQTTDASAPADENLAVIGVLFEISDTDNPVFKNIVDHLHNIIHSGDRVVLERFNIADMLPTVHTRYFRYLGSLTTPPCSEQVVWTLMFDRATISSAQVEEFRHLLDVENMTIADNFRPVQPLNNRLVKSSFYPSTATAEFHSNAAVHAISLATVMAIVFCFCFLSL